MLNGTSLLSRGVMRDLQPRPQRLQMMASWIRPALWTSVKPNYTLAQEFQELQELDYLSSCFGDISSLVTRIKNCERKAVHQLIAMENSPSAYIPTPPMAVIGPVISPTSSCLKTSQLHRSKLTLRRPANQ
jgi:hypothetical protein